MRLLLVLASAVTFCLTGFAAEQAPKPPQAPAAKAACTYCSDCKCKPGDCPSKCPLSYADVAAKVKAGERVSLSVGDEFRGKCQGHAPALAGRAPGTYDCYLDAKGEPVMHRYEYEQRCGGFDAKGNRVCVQVKVYK